MNQQLASQIFNFQKGKKIIYEVKQNGKLMCLNCNKQIKSKKRCSACRVAYYCSRRCQQKHWAIHQHSCVHRHLKEFKQWYPDPSGLSAQSAIPPQLCEKVKFIEYLKHCNKLIFSGMCDIIYDQLTGYYEPLSKQLNMNIYLDDTSIERNNMIMDNAIKYFRNLVDTKNKNKKHDKKLLNVAKSILKAIKSNANEIISKDILYTLNELFLSDYCIYQILFRRIPCDILSDKVQIILMRFSKEYSISYDMAVHPYKTTPKEGNYYILANIKTQDIVGELNGNQCAKLLKTILLHWKMYYFQNINHVRLHETFSVDHKGLKQKFFARLEQILTHQK